MGTRLGRSMRSGRFAVKKFKAPSVKACASLACHIVGTVTTLNVTQPSLIWMVGGRQNFGSSPQAFKLFSGCESAPFMTVQLPKPTFELCDVLGLLQWAKYCAKGIYYCDSSFDDSYL
jgi:hypothetical protein